MTDLFVNKPKRIFTFGCSFTNYVWPSWPDIIAYELDIPLYNYGKLSAGNQYIFNTVMQADNFYKFTADDLIIVSWTNMHREDIYKDGKWVELGNIYSTLFDDLHSEENKKLHGYFSDLVGTTVRDLALIKSVTHLLENRDSTYHFFKLRDFDLTNEMMYFKQDKSLTSLQQKIFKSYESYLSKIKKSFVDVLWNNTSENKIQQEINQVGVNYFDGHPDLLENLYYLETVLDYKFSDKTRLKVEETHKLMLERLRKIQSTKLQEIKPSGDILERYQQRTQGLTFNAQDVDFSDLYFVKSESVLML